MQDVQAWADSRQVSVQRVGIKEIQLPWKILQQDGQAQTVSATISVSADLSHEHKGSHMSRFLEVLEQWKDQPCSGPQLVDALAEVRQRLDAASAYLNMRFRYFVTKQAPVSGKPSTMGYPCRLVAALTPSSFDLMAGVEVPITTLCPCSKAISDAGAHSQRSWMRVNVRPQHGAELWIEDLIHQLESLGSCEVYPLLKRPDEKYVTERAYNNPKFVEDVVRDVVLALRQSPGIGWFEVECEAAESIHPHSAFAYQQEPLPADLPAVSVNGNGAYTAAETSGLTAPR